MDKNDNTIAIKETRTDNGESYSLSDKLKIQNSDYISVVSCCFLGVLITKQKHDTKS